MNRECGRCSLCCKVLTILREGIIEKDKPAGKWCPHACPGKGGCSRYEERPGVCRDFQCQWISDPTMGPEWYPRTSHMVVSSSAAEGVVYVDVDPAWPDAWKKSPYYEQLRALSRHVRVSIKVGDRHILLDDRPARSANPLVNHVAVVSHGAAATR